MLKFKIQNEECSEFHDLKTEITYDDTLKEPLNLLQEIIAVQNISPEKLNKSPYQKSSQNYDAGKYLNDIIESPNLHKQMLTDENTSKSVIDRIPCISKNISHEARDNSLLMGSLNETLSSRVQSNCKKIQDSDTKAEFSAKLNSYLIEMSNHNAYLIQSASSICSSKSDLETTKIFKKY